MLTHDRVVRDNSTTVGELFDELRSFRLAASANGKPAFKSHGKDDLVMAFALAAWCARPHLDKSPLPPM